MPETSVKRMSPFATKNAFPIKRIGRTDRNEREKKSKTRPRGNLSFLLIRYKQIAAPNTPPVSDNPFIDDEKSSIKEFCSFEACKTR